jgi:DNA-directed RNA polymerase specialized sigma24 family protein
MAAGPSRHRAAEPPDAQRLRQPRQRDHAEAEQRGREALAADGRAQPVPQSLPLGVRRSHRARAAAGGGERRPTALAFELTAAFELQRPLELGLASLGVNQREVLISSAIERLATEDIARMLTNEAVCQRLARARQQPDAGARNGVTARRRSHRSLVVN